jgi:hypothetical protein
MEALSSKRHRNELETVKNRSVADKGKGYRGASKEVTVK